MKSVKWIFVVIAASLIFSSPSLSANDISVSELASDVTLQRVDINHADVATLAKHLKGVGIKRARAIVAYREQHGPFESLEELQKVKGVGASVIEKNIEVIQF